MVVFKTRCCRWWGLILPWSLCSCFSSLYHGTMFLVALPSLSSLCQHPTGLVPGNWKMRQGLIGSAVPRKCQWSPLNAVGGSPIRHPQKQVTTLEASVSPRLLGSFCTVRAVTHWPSHLGFTQMTWDTSVFLPALGGARPAWWTWPSAECGSQSPAPSRPEPDPQCNNHHHLNNLL